jgi:hypothetical protein
MKLVWDDDETAGGFPVELPLITKDDNGKIISVVWTAWFGQGNNDANAMNIGIVDGMQEVVKAWSEWKLGEPIPQPPTAGKKP